MLCMIFRQRTSKRCRASRSRGDARFRSSSRLGNRTSPEHTRAWRLTEFGRSRWLSLIGITEDITKGHPAFSIFVYLGLRPGPTLLFTLVLLPGRVPHGGPRYQSRATQWLHAWEKKCRI